MTFVALLLAVAFTLLMLFKALEPFFAPRDEQLSLELIGEDLREVEALVAQRAALVLALRDLEYDWETDKVSDEDYKRFRRSYERQAVAAMRRLSAIHGGQDWQNTIEEALNARLADDAHLAPALEDVPAHQSNETAAQSEPLRCSNCDVPLAADDLFCSKCGTAVSASSTVDTADEAEAPPPQSPPPSEAATLPIADQLMPPSPAEVSQ